MKSVEHLGTRKGNICSTKLMSFESNNRNKNITDLCRGINEFKVTIPELILTGTRMVICSQSHRTF
jgi:hypothetical protein